MTTGSIYFTPSRVFFEIRSLGGATGPWGRDPGAVKMAKKFFPIFFNFLFESRKLMCLLMRKRIFSFYNTIWGTFYATFVKLGQILSGIRKALSPIRLSAISVLEKRPRTMVQFSLNLSERANEWAQRSARAKQAVQRKWTSERCERTDERVAQCFSPNFCRRSAAAYNSANELW